VSELAPAFCDTPRVAWVGEAPKGGAQRVTGVRTLEEFAALRPLPGVLVVDQPGQDPQATLEALAQPVLKEAVSFLVVDALEPGLHARALLHDVQCLPRSLAPALRDELLRAAVTRSADRRRADAMLSSAARAATCARFVVRTLEQAEGLSSLLAMCCPEPERRVGGFLELLINAIEHGNLEVTGPQKRELLAEGRWYSELLARLEDPRYASRVVRVTLDRRPAGVAFSIEDDGAGFDAKAVMERELTQGDTRHGRGIALARLMSFDELTYEGRGNRVVGRIR
jgi:hypothetical protein